MKLSKLLASISGESLNEIHQIKSTNSFRMFKLLKTLPFIKYVDFLIGRFSQSIDLILIDKENIDDLKEIVDKHNWYIEHGDGRRFRITQKYVDAARVKIPKFLYHTTPSQNVESILSNGLKAKSEDIRHTYPPRIYVADNHESLKYLEKELKIWKSNEAYSIIKIDTSGLDMELYIDGTSAYKGHYYIQEINVIPSENLKLLN